MSGKELELRNDYGYQGERMPHVTRNEELSGDALRKAQEAEAARVKALQEKALRDV